ncbi:beta-3-deoxy-D-manno-oct-2-ulosonic acid transferase [Thiomonas sp.]|uniref:capsular polysaccharide export protein, LipB/KpsS family n=1 Tax=Thiomonas sp. TaxID=2047785 RepID=UPI0026203CA3|nr:beta-3-deoxy-D-manno-oct-2-ulosonic acid transferase [Thiomonas sp.]
MSQLDRFADLPGVLYVVDFPRWKWPILRQCFAGRSLRFVSADAIPPQARAVVLWGRAPLPAALGADVPVLRVEDGFLRSVGLGAELVRPLSWVIDRRGMYYDASAPSELEDLLRTTEFDQPLIARARSLRERIVAEGLTKYNVGARRWQPPSQARRVVLVPGQVESDASIRFGAVTLRRNMELLRQVRSLEPDAFIVYKPHPDVAARLRITGVDEERAHQWCDAVVTDVPMHTLLDTVDAVHVLTSLTGFEALLRGRAVVCHGQPFYSGWGITKDQHPHPRRGRPLSLDALVAAAIILYPLYLDRFGHGLISPEQALDQLALWKAQKGTAAPWWAEIYRFFLRRFIGVR